MSDPSTPPPSYEPASSSTVVGGKRKSSLLGSIPRIHWIFAGIFFLFVAAGNIPSLAPPKADVETLMRVPKGAKASVIEAIESENKVIRERNDERELKASEELDEWNNKGKKRMALWLMFSQYLTGVILSIWIVYTIITVVLWPLLAGLAKFLGADFASIITPVVLLGLADVTAKSITQNIPTLPAEASGVLPALLTFIDFIIRPACNLITSFADVVLRNWVVGTAYLIIVIYAVLRKYFQPKF